MINKYMNYNSPQFAKKGEAENGECEKAQQCLERRTSEQPC